MLSFSCVTILSVTEFWQSCEALTPSWLQLAPNTACGHNMSICLGENWVKAGWEWALGHYGALQYLTVWFGSLASVKVTVNYNVHRVHSVLCNVQCILQYLLHYGVQ